MRNVVLWSALLIIAGIGLPSQATERKIYKCTSKDGVLVFSEHACGEDAKEVGTIDHSSSSIDAHAPANSSSEPDRSPDALQDISDSVADDNCRHDAEALGQLNTVDQIPELEQRRNSIQNELQYANNNLAGAVWEQGLRKQIGDLDIAIQQERTRISLLRAQANAAVRDALSACDKKAADRTAARH